MKNDDFLRELGSIAATTRLKRISDALLHDGKRMYRELGMDIEPNWFVVFKLLQQRGPLTVTEIADAIGFSHPSVITMVNKMSAAGYLAETRPPDDTRKRILSLSEKAISKLPEFETVWEAGTAGFKRMLADTDVLTALDILEERLEAKGFGGRTLDELKKFDQVEITDFRDEYAEAFARLNYEWIEKYFGIEEHDREQLDNPRESVIDSSGQIFFALVDGVVVGTVALIRLNYDVVELAKMAVSPDYQGYNIGSRLIRECIAHARREGMSYIVLESNRKLFAAINLYRKFGFRETALDPNSLYSRANIRMELAIQQSNL